MSSACRSDGFSSPTSNPDILTPRIHPTSSITSSLFNSPIDPLSAETSPSLLPTAGIPPLQPGRTAPLPPQQQQQQQQQHIQTKTEPIDPPSASAMPAHLRRDTTLPSRTQQQHQHTQRLAQLPPEQGHDAGPGEILVISGGSGYNDLVSATPGATYVMPISDNGGSSSEIIRVLGGPSIGDLRSRLNRLIPIPSRPHPTPFPYPEAYVPPPSNAALHALLSYRLPSTGSSRAIKQEWHDILEGRHPLWRGIEADRKEVIRGFLVHFESEVLRRAHRNFNFRSASIGNFFLAAAQKFFRSIQSAIFLFSATTQIDAAQSGSKVVPVINTNHTATIAAQLEDGDVVVGQCEISHPALTASTSRSGVAVGRRAAPIGSGTGTGTGTRGSTMEPGTPSSAIFDPFERRAPVDIHDAVSRISARSHLHESFSAADLDASQELAGRVQQEHEDHQLGTSYDSMSSSLVLPTTGPPGPASRSHTPSLAFKDRGRTTVGNTGDGLDPDEDDSEAENAEAGDGTGDEDDADGHGGVAGNIVFSKGGDEADGGEGPALPSRIERIFYVNAYRNEIFPAPNPSFLASLDRSRTLIYSCGSLWTSLVPCLSLRGVASHIATSPSLRYKVLLLNTTHDRETKGLTAVDFVRAIASSLNRTDVPGQEARWKTRDLVSHLVYFDGGEVDVDLEALHHLGIACVKVSPTSETKTGRPKFDENAIRDALARITAAPTAVEAC